MLTNLINIWRSPALMETIVAAIDDLNAAVTALQTEVATVGASMDSNFAALTAALAAAGVNNDPAIEAAATAIQADIATLQQHVTADTPPASGSPSP